MSGAFGVEKAIYDETGTILLRHGKKQRTELGALITSQYKRKIMSNINLDTRATLYTDYLKDFGNIDVDWQMAIEMTVNKYVKANLGTHLLYDNDIKNKREVDGMQITEGSSRAMETNYWRWFRIYFLRIKLKVCHKL